MIQLVWMKTHLWIFSILDNDDMIDGATLSSVEQPDHGTIVVNDDGTVTYTPDADYNGPDSFTYTITDEDGETSTANCEHKPLIRKMMCR